ncbi:hypothetical protein K8B33_08425 [Alcanivorax sp. JB21]|uniref:hypothetical protein n=1 Tax=Alcanivorax limicola TaxID=2874102 RepID=UPI001CC1BF88|nr:hypothetical protein [Alcanivorax limicola]MBZ2189120.1 hypothetical protein [Alcanivorax limicola]
MMAVWLAAAAPLVSAQSGGVVGMQIEEGVRIFLGGGYVLRESPRFGALEAGEREELVVRLQGGRAHVMLAACDQDCDDIDLVLRDSRGNVVASDLLDDDLPVLNYTPKVEAEYRVSVIMVNCSIEPCGYGLAVMLTEE